MVTRDQCTRCRKGLFEVPHFSDTKFSRCGYCRYQRDSIPCTNCFLGYIEWDRSEKEVRKCSKCGYVYPFPFIPASFALIPRDIGVLGGKVGCWIFIAGFMIAVLLLGLMFVNSRQSECTEAVSGCPNTRRSTGEIQGQTHPDRAVRSGEQGRLDAPGAALQRRRLYPGPRRLGAAAGEICGPRVGGPDGAGVGRGGPDHRGAGEPVGNRADRRRPGGHCRPAPCTACCCPRSRGRTTWWKWTSLLRHFERDKGLEVGKIFIDPALETASGIRQSWEIANASSASGPHGRQRRQGRRHRPLHRLPVDAGGHGNSVPALQGAGGRAGRRDSLSDERRLDGHSRPGRAAQSRPSRPSSWVTLECT